MHRAAAEAGVGGIPVGDLGYARGADRAAGVEDAAVVGDAMRVISPLYWFDAVVGFCGVIRVAV